VVVKAKKNWNKKKEIMSTKKNRKVELEEKKI